jgi:hypothetical protein
MSLDLRFPIGLIFSIFGVILAAEGIRRRVDTIGVNINLWWGLVMLAFGIVMFLLAVFGKHPQVKSGVVLQNPENIHPGR